MLNLLKFRERAIYEGSEEPEVSGRQAYMRYAQTMQQLVPKYGGRHVYIGEARQLFIGEGPLHWDWVALVEYPSRETFRKVTQDPLYAEISAHRRAGLADSVLVVTEPVAPAAQ
jgi:uncharacterized protein (DUF1330 family)